jgi:hypothetical protein
MSRRRDATGVIVVINTTALYWRVRDWVIGKKSQRY